MCILHALYSQEQELGYDLEQPSEPKRIDHGIVDLVSVVYEV